jgi:Na+-translocating ferredoxin:NAD+ oxidoreductase RnfD subunit
LWLVLIGAGVLVTLLSWLFLGSATGRIYPVLVSYLLLVVMFKSALVPHWVLQKQHLFVGDARDARPINLESYPTGWRSIPDRPHFAGLYESSPPTENLVAYTSGPAGIGNRWLSVDSMLRDAMPPLEDLILGGYPGPIGAGSAVMVIVGGLFLLFRGVIDYRIPLLICLMAFVTFLILPIPAAIRPATPEMANAQIVWRWFAMHDRSVGPAVGITFANYELMAGPLLFMSFFLATAPEIRPMSRRGRFLFAVLLGVLAAGLQLYISVSFGPYLALLIASLVTTGLDRFFKARCLI